ncbi:hypothetical protein KXD40_003163 [Peronospora effusa]|uniref:Uncharacterized protein n=1 Tax=Peronospora effusa TaxID=542832 RepID=A0A3M6VCE7_9STRA|nr:hypothetical protein DD238_004547 [Peronospora effusa]RQM14149.1 hypothetical protein DD237_004826 [Peronospora effusa]UIZ29619.1 hypothetical protein KXD40_003163 [Peronospora effusa]CAI5716332.1 unnamed protein product [Peronospora effusa]
MPFVLSVEDGLAGTPWMISALLILKARKRKKTEVVLLLEDFMALPSTSMYYIGQLYFTGAIMVAFCTTMQADPMTIFECREEIDSIPLSADIMSRSTLPHPQDTIP